jgi:hypothetical protein
MENKSSPPLEIERHRTPNIRHRAYVIAAVTSSVAFMECVINEVLQDVTDGIDDHIGVLSKAVRQRLIGYWMGGERSSVLDKYDRALKLAGRPVMDRGVHPVQSVTVLIALRNHFVHYKPEDIGITLEPPKLAQRLRGRFADNKLMIGAGNPWFPDHAIGAGCANWAHETARGFVDGWTSVMRLTGLPYQLPGPEGQEAP